MVRLTIKFPSPCENCGGCHELGIETWECKRNDFWHKIRTYELKCFVETYKDAMRLAREYMYALATSGISPYGVNADGVELRGVVITIRHWHTDGENE